MNTLLFHAILIPLCTCPLLDACSARAFVGGVVFFLNPNPFVYLLLRVRSMFVYLLLEKHVRVLAPRDTHVQHVLFVGGFFFNSLVSDDTPDTLHCWEILSLCVCR